MKKTKEKDEIENIIQITVLKIKYIYEKIKVEAMNNNHSEFKDEYINQEEENLEYIGYRDCYEEYIKKIKEHNSIFKKIIQYN